MLISQWTGLISTWTSCGSYYCAWLCRAGYKQHCSKHIQVGKFTLLPLSFPPQYSPLACDAVIYCLNRMGLPLSCHYYKLTNNHPPFFVSDHVALSYVHSLRAFFYYYDPGLGRHYNATRYTTIVIKITDVEKKNSFYLLLEYKHLINDW